MKTDNAPRFTVPVTVATTAIQGTLTATFLAKRISETKEIEKRVKDIAEFVREVTADVRDVNFPGLELKARDAEGRFFESTADGLADLLDWPGVGGAMQDAFYKGLWSAQEKNSEPPAHG